MKNKLKLVTRLITILQSLKSVRIRPNIKKIRILRPGMDLTYNANNTIFDSVSYLYFTNSTLQTLKGRNR